MKGFRTYPLWVWLGLIAVVCVSVCITNPILALALYIGAALLSAARDYFLNPLRREQSPYLQWLKTVPYTEGKPLPNGSPLPGLHDLVFITVYCLSFARLDVDPYNLAMLVVGAVCVFLAIFNLIVARQLLNLGPQWLGYAILLILLLSFGTLKLLMLVRSIWVLASPIVAVLVAFLLAIIGFRIMLKEYPWSSLALPQPRSVNGQSIKELMYGHSYSKLQELGQPFTSLSPKAEWPRLSSAHVWGVSLLAAALDFIVLIYAPEISGGLFLFIGVSVTLLRFFTFYGSRHLAIPAWGLVPIYAKNSIPLNRRLSVSIVTLLVLFASCATLLALLPQVLAIWLEPLATLVVIVAAFRLPPSRATWETTGISEIDILPAAERAKIRSSPGLRV